jgi:hypothetical protein
MIEASLSSPSTEIRLWKLSMCVADLSGIS